MLDNALQSGQGVPKWKHHLRLGVYLGPSPNHAHSVALMLNPCTDHVSPQFHAKFNDFFEIVQDKATDLDAPELEWKYLSSFTVQKGPAKTGVKGVLNGLLAPRRGLPRATTMPLPSNAPVQPAEPQQDLQMPMEPRENEAFLPALPQPAPPTAQQLPQLQLEQLLPTVCQTRSGRVIWNTLATSKASVSGAKDW